jgi:hypothetical protein
MRTSLCLSSFDIIVVAKIVPNSKSGQKRDFFSYFDHKVRANRILDKGLSSPMGKIFPTPGGEDYG